VPKPEVVVAAPKHEEIRLVKPKAKTPKVQAAPRGAAPAREPEVAKTEVLKVELPKVEAPKVELLKVEAPDDVAAAKIELPKIEPLPAVAVPGKVEMPEMLAEEPKPAPVAVVVPELAKSAAREPSKVGANDYSPLHHEAAVPPRQVERPVSLPKVESGIGLKAGRIVDRLKAFRAQRADPVGLNRDSKPRLAANLRPRMVQINAGRIEISVPTLYGILAGLVACIILLVVYRIGHLRGEQQSNAAGSVKISQTSPVDSAVVSQGNNTIVIAQHSDKNQLLPLVQYFQDNGITVGTIAIANLRKILTSRGLGTNAVQGEGFLLMTVDRYNNPDAPGTDGYNIKQKIIDLGAKYKAPKGYDSFAPESFRKAYGLKVQ
jgi:hypothetical protein